MSARWLVLASCVGGWCMSAAVHAQDIEVVSYPVADLVVPVKMDYTEPAGGPRHPPAFEPRRPQEADAPLPVATPIAPPALATAAAPKKNNGPAHLPKTCEAELINLVCRMCEPASWRCNGGAGTISYLPRDMRLVVRQTPAVHQQVGCLLSGLRRLQDREVAVETRMVTLSGERVKTLEAAVERGGVGALLPADGPDGVCLGERECFLLLTLIQADPTAVVHQAPKITMFSGQKAFVSVREELGPRSGDVDQDGEPVKDRGVGMHHVLQPVIEHGRHSVRLYTRASVTEVSDRKAPGRVFTTRALENTYRVPAGQTLIAKLGRTASGQHQYVMFTPRIVDEHEAIVGETKVARPAQGSHYPRVFEVGDLVTPLGAEPASATKSKHAAPFACTAPEKLVELIASAVAQNSWTENGGAGQIAFFPIGNALVVRQTGEIHDEVEALLAALRRLQDLRVGLDCRIVEMPEAVARRINARRPQSRDLAGLPSPRRYVADGAEEQDFVGPEGRSKSGDVAAAKGVLPLPSGSLGLQALSFHDNLILRELLIGEADHVSQTRLGGLAFNGQKLRLDATTRRTFVTDLNVTTADGRLVVTPIKRVVREGMVVQATPVVSADRKHVRLELSIDISGLQGEPRPHTVTVGSGSEKREYTVCGHVPLGGRAVKSVVQGIDAGGALVLSLPGSDGGWRQYLIVTPRAYVD